MSSPLIVVEWYMTRDMVPFRPATVTGSDLMIVPGVAAGNGSGTP
jgi:hypothetical protein